MTSLSRLNPSTTVVRGTVLGADVGGEVVLMSVEAGRYYGLDAVGSDIWRRLEKPARIETLCADLVTDYDGEAGVIERDVLALLEELLAQGLIEMKG